MDESQAVIRTLQGCPSDVHFVLCNDWTTNEGSLIIHIKHKMQTAAPEKRRLICTRLAQKYALLY